MYLVLVTNPRPLNEIKPLISSDNFILKLVQYCVDQLKLGVNVEVVTVQHVLFICGTLPFMSALLCDTLIESRMLGSSYFKVESPGTFTYCSHIKKY